MKIDYKRLNERIVRQAYEVSTLVLTEQMKTQLFQNKIDRAVEIMQVREQSTTKID